MPSYPKISYSRRIKKVDAAWGKGLPSKYNASPSGNQAGDPTGDPTADPAEDYAEDYAGGGGVSAGEQSPPLMAA